MPSSRIYWDADVFLSYINGTSGRADVIAELLHKSKQGEIEIVTSTISMVEVAFAATEKAGKLLDRETEDAIDALWADRGAVKLIEVDQLVNKEARALMRIGLPKSWRLKAMDAIHLATAKLSGAGELNTYNLCDFEKFSEALGIIIREPYLEQSMLGL